MDPKEESALGEWFAQGAYRTRFAEGYASGEVIELLRNCANKFAFELLRNSEANRSGP